MSTSALIGDSHAVLTGQPIAPADRLPAVWVVVLTLALALAQASPMIANLWTTGYFGDTDDALRMVQVRDLIAGQAWYDMSAYRINPADPLFMHWSRIVDVPIAILMKTFGLFASPVLAERLARLAFPAIMLLALFIGLARTARVLLGHSAILPVLLLCALSGAGVGQFQPGRIDHHAPQIVLLVWMLCFTVEALQNGKHRFAFYAASAAVVSLGISIENILFIAAMSAIWPVLWLLNYRNSSKMIFSFGAGLLTVLPLVYGATIGFSRWSDTSCDALSLVYFGPLMIGAAGCCLLGMTPAPDQKSLRVTTLIAVAFACAGSMYVLAPECLNGPLSSVDPLLRKYWLDNVHEARSLKASFNQSPEITAVLFGPALFGSLFALVAGYFEKDESKTRWLAVSAFITAGLVTTTWQIRGGTSLAPLAALGGAWCVLLLRAWLETKGIEAAATLGLLAIFPLSAVGWAVTSDIAGRHLVSAPAPASTAIKDGDRIENCFAAGNYDEVAQLPAGLVIAPIDVGAHLLAHTHHSVLAAAYHRNNTGNKKALDILFALPSTARALAISTGAQYVAVCMGASERRLLRKFAPFGLATKLADGKIPAWLDQTTRSDTISLDA